MPLIPESTYNPPFLFRNGHVQSIYPTVFRYLTGVRYVRERIATPDHDFIDLDWSCVGGRRAVLIAHGLEGHSRRSYMLGMIKAFNKRGWDAIAFNFRGCSGEPNRRLRSYHSGETGDLHTVICHIIKQKPYAGLAIIGFSIGGNITLKYLGEKGSALFPEIQSAAAISVPCDLKSSAEELSKRSNALYMKRFLKMFHEKIRLKMQHMPEKINDIGYKSIRTFKDFDARYTAPIHGFSSVEEYWNKCSCKQFISEIKIPALLISAQDDPFLPEDCFPLKEAKDSHYLVLETPKYGGHVGFIAFNAGNEYWHETRVAAFITENQ